MSRKKKKPKPLEREPLVEPLRWHDHPRHRRLPRALRLKLARRSRRHPRHVQLSLRIYGAIDFLDEFLGDAP